MLLIHCPYCQEALPELEFIYEGEAHVERPVDMPDISDEAMRDFLFIRQNTRGLHFERWRHLHGCARFFCAARDTVNDKFLVTYKAGAPRPGTKALATAAQKTGLPITGGAKIANARKMSPKKLTTKNTSSRKKAKP